MTTANSPRRARCPRRTGERGAAILIVVLVIAMLTGIGVFAARSASLSNTASGHARQMTQTYYLNEYAMTCGMASIEAALDVAVDRMNAQPDSTCSAMTDALGATCLRLYPSAMEQQLVPGGKLLEPPAPGAPGSLGPNDLDPYFAIELTNYGPGPFAPGFDLSPTSPAPFRFYLVTMTSVGQIRPKGAATWSSTEAARARLVLGPIPFHP